MANTNFNQLPIAVGLIGTEIVPILQAGTDKRTTTAAISALNTSGPPSNLEIVNQQAGATYTIQFTDATKLVLMTNASGPVVTLPSPGTLTFTNGYWFEFLAVGALGATINSVGSTIDGLTSVTLLQNQSLRIATDGTNYFAGLPGQISTQWLNGLGILATPTVSDYLPVYDSITGLMKRITPENLSADQYINVMAYPYLAKGDGTTNDYAAIIAAQTAARAAGLPLAFPAGRTYVTNTTIDFAYNAAEVIALGPGVILKFTGTGLGFSINGGAFNPSGGITRVVFGGPYFIELQGTSTCTNLFYFNNVNWSQIKIRGRDCTGSVVRGDNLIGGIPTGVACVGTEFDITISAVVDNLNFTTTPTLGLDLHSVYASTFRATVENCSGFGVNLYTCVNNLFLSGTSESNTGGGVYSDVNSSRNTFINFDCESNGSVGQNWQILGNNNSFIGINGSATSGGGLYVNGTSNVFQNCIFDTSVVIASSAVNTLLEGGSVAGTLTDSGTNTTRRGVNGWADTPLPATEFPALTGDVTTTAGSVATTVAKIHGTTVSGTTGTVNVVFSTSPTLVTPNLGTPSAVTLTNGTGLPLSTGVTGTLQAANFPALTGDVSTSAGSLATAIGANKVTVGMLAQAGAFTVLGNNTGSTANISLIAGVTDQVLRVNSANTSLGFGAINLASASAVTGQLIAACFPILTGDITTAGGALATTINANAVTNAKAAQMATNTIKGNNTGGTANATDLTVSQVSTLLGLTSLNYVANNNSGGVGMGNATTTSSTFVATYLQVNSGTSAGFVWNAANRWSMYSAASGALAITNETGSADLLRMTTTGSVIHGSGAIATSATDGFTYIASCAGTPTGTPTAFTGRVPMVFDTTNSQFWFYTGGAWKQPKTPAAAAIVTWQ